MGQFDRRVDACRFEQIGVLGPDAVETVEIYVVDPFENQRVSNAGRLFQLLATLRLGATFQQIVGCLHAGSFKLRRVDGSDAFNVDDFHGSLCYGCKRQQSVKDYAPGPQPTGTSRSPRTGRLPSRPGT